MEKSQHYRNTYCGSQCTHMALKLTFVESISKIRIDNDTPEHLLPAILEYASKSNCTIVAS